MSRASGSLAAAQLLRSETFLCFYVIKFGGAEKSLTPRVPDRPTVERCGGEATFWSLWMRFNHPFLLNNLASIKFTTKSDL